MKIVFVLERSDESPHAYKYTLVDADGSLVVLESTLQDGFVPAALVPHGGYTILLEEELRP
ncbi:MAG TPA: hypothetical protein VHI98_10010 [Vicinamibacterales bacterium]|jgi:hypothetical protein|nr:hypothetical protein [Vicinamibacterales bacterium]